MIPVKIISRVEIPSISEEVISNLIKAEILKDNPGLIINNIAFERKLNPNRITASVDAQMGTEPVKLSAPATQTVAAETTVESPSEEQEPNEPTESSDEKADPEVESPVTTVADLFTEDDE